MVENFLMGLTRPIQDIFPFADIPAIIIDGDQQAGTFCNNLSRAAKFLYVVNHTLLRATAIEIHTVQIEQIDVFIDVIQNRHGVSAPQVQGCSIKCRVMRVKNVLAGIQIFLLQINRYEFAAKKIHEFIKKKRTLAIARPIVRFAERPCFNDGKGVLLFFEQLLKHDAKSWIAEFR